MVVFPRTAHKQEAVRTSWLAISVVCGHRPDQFELDNASIVLP